jgi:hypothetical protein
MTMPNTIGWLQAGIWFALAFCLGAGWTLGVWLVGRIVRKS